jgi:hypothetical protein
VNLRAFHERVIDGNTHVFVASTAGVKRDGLDLDLAGMRVDNYLKNPVVLWCHDYAGRNLPIGKTTKLTVTKTRMRAHVIFDPGDEFAQQIERKYRDGYLSAVSIGWNPLKAQGGRITESDMLDLSAVPIPADADALMEREMAQLRGILGIPEPAADADTDADEPAPVCELDTRTAIPPHNPDKAPEDAAWDGPACVAALPSEEAILRRSFAWVNPDLDPDTKAAYKLPHHDPEGRTVWRGVAAAMARLLQSATMIPDGERGDVWAHLARHYRQFGKEPPEQRCLQGMPVRLIEGALPNGEWQCLRAELAELVGDKVAALKQAIADYENTEPEPPTPEVPEPTPPPELLAGLGALAQALGEVT